MISASASNDPVVLNKYHAGFNECAVEVSRYLSSMEGVDVELRARLLNHLANSISNLPGGVTNAASPPPPIPPQMPSNPSTATVSALPAVASVRPTIQTLVTPTVVSAAGHMNPTTVSSTINASEYAKLQPQPPSAIVNNQITTYQPSFAPNSNACASQGSNQAKIVGGVHVIPTKLPTGEIAFVLPQNPPPSYIIPIYAGAQVNSIPSPTAGTVATHLPTMTAVEQTTVPNHVTTQHTTQVYSSSLATNFQNLASSSGAPVMMIPSTQDSVYRAVNLQPSNPGSLAGQMPIQGLQKDEDVWRPW